jgi:tetratricopeptide (TPR) repeat protein
MIWIIPIIVIAICLVVIVFVLAKKIPQLRVIDVKSIPEERTRELKERIIMGKLSRAGRGKINGIAKIISAIVKSASKSGRRAVQKLYAIEQYYQKLNRTATEGQHAYSHETIKQLTTEAETLIRQEEYIPAEKIYIDIISHNPKSVDAYEGLGNLYLKKGEYEQARETLKFTLRLSPNDASVHVSLAELEIKLGNNKQALESLRKAVGKRSKNPKYLDLYIESALVSGSLKDARSGIQLLKRVNPENQKIQEFEERFMKLKDEYIAKTSTHQAEDESKTHHE